ncbi:MAG TPA: transcriptional activator RfaH [Verrucomicrobiae bacterium]|nr:transcriptional activator RfaH [Verrucomicrobiae bacterium]
MEPEMQNIGTAWYCARTKPKHEHIAASNLERNFGLEVFNPRLRLERATRRGPMRVIEALFPCYIFVRFEFAELFDVVRYSNGISSLVHFRNIVPAVPDAVIEDLRRRFESDQPMPVEDALSAGDQVTVAEGAMMGFHGVVLRVLPARQRVQILLDFLGRMTPAEVERKSLKVENRCMADLVPSLAAA